MADQLIQAIVKKPFVKYQSAVIDLPYEADNDDRELTILFLFSTIEVVAENDNCTQVQFNCDQSLASNELEQLEMIWETCTVDILSTPPTIVDNKIVSATFTVGFADLDSKNYFQLWGVKGGARFLIAKGVIFARK